MHKRLEAGATSAVQLIKSNDGMPSGPAAEEDDQSQCR